ncbi:hypothetical protein CaCOL14_010133 [Colletotrichum acutatum]
MEECAPGHYFSSSRPLPLDRIFVHSESLLVPRQLIAHDRFSRPGSWVDPDYAHSVL